MLYIVVKCLCLKRTLRELKLIKINHKMKVSTVASMLFFSYLDTLPKLHIHQACTHPSSICSGDDAYFGSD